MRKEVELRENRLFAGCRPDQIRWIARAADELDLPAGRAIVTEGETARGFVVVLQGEVAATNGHGPVVCGPGSHFGATGLIDGGTNDTTVESLTPVRILVFEPRAFRGLLERVPSVSRKLLRGLVEQVREGQAPRRLRAVS